MWSLGGADHVYLDLPRTLMVIPTVAITAAAWFGLAGSEAWQAARTGRPTAATSAAAPGLRGLTPSLDGGER